MGAAWGQPAFCLLVRPHACIAPTFCARLYAAHFPVLCDTQQKEVEELGRKGLFPQGCSSGASRAALQHGREQGRPVPRSAPPAVCGGGCREASVLWEALCLLQMPLQIERRLSGFS